MILSKRTVDIIKNYSQISPKGMVWPVGNTLSIEPDTARNLLSVAEIEEYNSTQFRILDMVQFTNVITSFDTPEIELVDSGAGAPLIKVCDAGEYSRGSFTLNQAAEMLVKQPEEILFPEDDLVGFELTIEMMSRIFKSIAIIQTPQIAIEGRNGEIIVRGYDPENSGINQYQMRLADTTETFGVSFEVDQFSRLLKTTNYIVSISRRGIARFQGDRIVYYFASKVLNN